MAINKRKVLDAARKHAQKGAKAKALKEYNQLLKADPHDAKLLLEVGDAYRRWGQPEEAIAQYSKVASQYRQDGFDARAVAVFKQILNLDQKHYSAYVALSELYQRMGLDSEAVASLQIAADGYHKEGRKPEALDLLRQMAALDPSNTTNRLKVAELLRQEGMEDDAVVEYQAVAQELQHQQNSDQLIAVQERIIEIRPNHLETLRAQVRCLMTAEELDRAEPIAVHALNTETEPAQYEMLIDLYAQMGHAEKLADATRGLAKLYRDRGDEDKARELMQRLPSEDFIAPGAGLAVDLSEAEEPMLDDEELLDQPFLAIDDDFESIASNSASSDPGLSGNSLSDSAAQIDLNEVSMDASHPIETDQPTPAPLVVPEGDPDQLLAEASVYLRYGKRDQAILSLKGVLVQDPNHRAALEKLGEAYAEDGQNSEAVKTWLQAAERIRLEGDAESLEILRDRISALDPGLAAQIASVEGISESPSDISLPKLGLDMTETDSLGMELDLDVEVDLNLDDAIEEVAASETNSGFEFELPVNPDEFEIDLDEVSETESAGVEEAPTSAPAPTSGSADFVTEDEVLFELDDDLELGTDEFVSETEDIEESVVDVSASVDVAAEFEMESSADLAIDHADQDENDDGTIEFEIDASDLAIDEFVTDAGVNPVAAADEVDAERLAETGNALTTDFNEEIEEAEFYVAQDMFDEAEAIVGRVLQGAPKHARALVLRGEIAAAQAEVVETSAEALIGAPEPAEADRASAILLDDEGDDRIAVDPATDPVTTDLPEDLNLSLKLDAADALTDESEVSFEIELDVDRDADAGKGGRTDELTDENQNAAILSPAEDSIEPEETDAETEKPLTAESLATLEEVREESVAEGVVADEGERFDLREALAGIFDDDSDESDAEVCGVKSTVDDGFDSIFSDFKKGVSATLGDGDYDTRYDLGIAYREMGLFDDAIGEFRICLDSPTRRFDSLYLMGLCSRDLTRWDDAVNHLEQALALPEIPEERLAGVYFDLSIAQEGAGDSSRALASVQRVIQLDSRFPGAAARLAVLEPGESALPEIGEPGECYESFDELFDGDDDDERGDMEVAAAAPTDAFESFADVVSEAEACIQKAEKETSDPADSRKSRRKKISFV